MALGKYRKIFLTRMLVEANWVVDGYLAGNEEYDHITVEIPPF